MSEEEIIERVNKFINITVLYGKTYGMTCDDLKKYQQVFRGLLDLYNNEKEKNEELENADLNIVYMTGFYDGENKWKNKIREILDDIENDKPVIAECKLRKLLEEE